MMEEIRNAVDSAFGITPVGDYVLIDERKEGYVTTKFEVRLEERDGNTFMRLQVRSSKNDGRAGGLQRTFAWPVADPSQPAELAVWADRILEAGAPGATMHDDRGVLGRWFDRMNGTTQLNWIPVLAELAGPPRRWVSAHLYENRSGTWVAVTHHTHGRGALRLVMPIASITALKAKIRPPR